MYEGSHRREKTSRLEKRRGSFSRKLRAQKDSSTFERSKGRSWDPVGGKTKTTGSWGGRSERPGGMRGFPLHSERVEGFRGNLGGCEAGSREDEAGITLVERDKSSREGKHQPARPTPLCPLCPCPAPPAG